MRVLLIANDHRAVGDPGVVVELPAAEVVPEATSRMFCTAQTRVRADRDGTDASSQSFHLHDAASSCTVRQRNR